MKNTTKTATWLFTAYIMRSSKELITWEADENGIVASVQDTEIEDGIDFYIVEDVLDDEDDYDYVDVVLMGEPDAKEYYWQVQITSNARNKREAFAKAASILGKHLHFGLFKEQCFN